jgi:predicted transcriptional regulator
MTDKNDENSDLMLFTTDIVAAYVGNNSVGKDDLPALISQIHGALRDVQSGGAQNLPKPAVPIKKSVTPDFIICLEDGKKLKMLRRHLKSQFGMTPEDYRQRWGLPSDYPMVAPNYAKKRRELAKQIGLGKKHRKKK